jgi:hypothetical protein
VLGGSGTAVAEPATGYPAMPASAEGPFPVTKVSDGDTIWVNENGERVKIWMIGLDRPELHARRPGGVRSRPQRPGQAVYLPPLPSVTESDAEPLVAQPVHITIDRDIRSGPRDG